MEKDAYSIVEFCQRHGFSRASFYNLEKDGEAPRMMRVGGRILISKEAAADWRRAREVPQVREPAQASAPAE